MAMGDSAPADTGGGVHAMDTDVNPLDAIVLEEQTSLSAKLHLHGTAEHHVQTALPPSSISFDGEQVRKKPKKVGLKRQCKICGGIGHYQKTCQSRPQGRASIMEEGVDRIQPNIGTIFRHMPVANLQRLAPAPRQPSERALMAKQQTGELQMPNHISMTSPSLLDSSAQANSVLEQVRLDPENHTPFIITEGSVGYCVVCLSKKTKDREASEQEGRTCLKCARCGVFLCSTLDNHCWKSFHTETDPFEV